MQENKKNSNLLQREGSITVTKVRGKMGRNRNHENLEVWRRGRVGLWLRHLRKGS